MNIITISREFGSGGRELGKRLSELLEYDYYDNEILSMISEKSGIDSDYIENILTNCGWKNQKITFSKTFNSSSYLQSTSKVDLLLQQKRVIEEIANLGKNCVIVGRNADIILRKHQPFNIFVCAETDAKIERCIERATRDENLSEKELLKKIKYIDKIRSETREILSDTPWGQRNAYHLTINTTSWDIKELASATADFIKIWFRRK